MAAVSIIVPVFNHPDLLKETLDSVVSQSVSDWECIVVDDGSMEETGAVMQEYRERDTRFHVIQRNRQPKGANTCRNMGLEAARGDYVLFLDADDVLLPHCLEQRLKIIAQYPDHSFWLFNTGQFAIEPGDIDYSRTYQGEDPLTLFLENRMMWQTMAAIWRKKAIKDIGGFNEKYERMQDVELYTRAMLLLNDYYVDDGEIDAYYRVNPGKYESQTFKAKALESLAMYITDMVRIASPSVVGRVRGGLRKNYRLRIKQVYGELHLLRKEVMGLLDAAQKVGVINNRDSLLIRLIAQLHLNRIFGIRGVFFRLI